MIEILTAIILTCNINTGHKAVGFLESNARVCRVELIRCMDRQALNMFKGNNWYPFHLKKCLLEKK